MMWHMSLQTICTLAVLSLFTSQVRAGCCFCWDNFGTQSGCQTGVDSWDECEDIRDDQVTGFDNCYLVPEPCDCEDVNHQSGGIHPVRTAPCPECTSHQDVRWRYVVLVNNCVNASGKVCKEWHQLMRCVKDDLPGGVQPDNKDHDHN
jgi:hypothetical protein